ncbi:polysaccharide biosynthesis protein [Sphaerisporangium aureirubrum]|uniref:hypothetical protein n=1 Tax=Sphaerisporangium aureirubrum TaxID=1544736 RepID=UPI003637DE6E
MTDLYTRIGAWVRPTARRQMRDFAVLGAAGQVEAGLSLAATAVLVRLTGATAAGEVLLAQSMAAVWALLWDARLGDTAQRFVPVQDAGAAGAGTWLFARLLRVDAVIGLAGAAAGITLATAAGRTGLSPPVPAALLLLALAYQGATSSRGTSAAGFAIAGRLEMLGRLRIGLAVVGCAATLTALVLGGPVAYLAAQVSVAAVATVWLAVLARRAVTAALGPAPREPQRVPAGLRRFAVTTSAATSLSLASDNGILTLAGLLGGPALVTYLKIAAAPGRLFLSTVSTVTAQLYPRLVAAAVRGDTAAVRRDVVRASLPLAVLGAAAAGLALPLTRPALALVYGPAYVTLTAATLVLLAAGCLRGTVVWAKVLPLAVGRPGVRLLAVAVDGVLVAAALLFALHLAGGPPAVTLAYALGSLTVAGLVAAGWFALLRPLVGLS